MTRFDCISHLLFLNVRIKLSAFNSISVPFFYIKRLRGVISDLPMVDTSQKKLVCPRKRCTLRHYKRLSLKKKDVRYVIISACLSKQRCMLRHCKRLSVKKRCTLRHYKRFSVKKRCTLRHYKRLSVKKKDVRYVITNACLSKKMYVTSL